MIAARPRPVYLDSDSGIGDALAVAFLLATRGIRLAGIGTVSGDVDARIGAVNTLSLLATAGRDAIPVAIGRSEPLFDAVKGRAARGHGRNGICDLELPRSARSPVNGSAAELLIRLAHENPGALEIIATGPLTNIAEALCLDPELPRLVRCVTVMGGAVCVPGNAGKYAEANIAADPEAAADVFAAGWPVTLIPLDVAVGHAFDETHRRPLAASARLTQQALGQMLRTSFTYYTKHSGARRLALHDCLTAAFATGDLEPERLPTLRICVDTGAGPHRGQTRFARVEGEVTGDVRSGQNPHQARVLLSLRRKAAPGLLERILSLAPVRSAAPVSMPVATPVSQSVYASDLSEPVAA